MKKCLSCSNVYGSCLNACPQCGFTPVKMSGLVSYTEDLPSDGEGFKSSYFSELTEVEGSSFWFVSRGKLIVWILKKYVRDFGSFLEIGCGNGHVLSRVCKELCFTQIFGSDLFIQGLQFASDRVPSAQFMKMDARNIPYVEEFNVIGAFDVLEHVKEDGCVLDEVYVALKNRGLLVLTVPQHKWLWSDVDIHACHVRRYTKKNLHKKLEDSGFKIIRSTSFVSLLLPAMFISRLKKNKTNIENNLTNELNLSPMINSFLYMVMKAEILLIRMGVSFPFGGSRLVVAQKK